jgi:hypothetical protein
MLLYFMVYIFGLLVLKIKNKGVYSSMSPCPYLSNKEDRTGTALGRSQLELETSGCPFPFAQQQLGYCASALGLGITLSNRNRFSYV